MPSIPRRPLTADAPPNELANVEQSAIEHGAARVPIWYTFYTDALRVRPWQMIGRHGDEIWSAFFTYRGDSIRILSVRRARHDEEAVYRET
jgi:uncharacterized DUF497 family protein